MDVSNALPQDVIKVRDLASQGKRMRLQGEYRFDTLKTEGAVVGDWEIQPETAGLNVKGHMQGVVLIECARCLNDFPMSVDLEIDEHYVFDRYTDPHEREKELHTADFFEVIDEEGELDLKDLAHQFLVLESANQSTCGRPECTLAAV